MVSADMVGRGEVAKTENASGTWTVSANDYMYFESMQAFTVNFGGSITPAVMSFELDLTQTVFGIGQASDDILTFGMKEFGGTFKASLLFSGSAPDTAALRSAFTSGTRGEIITRWGNATAGTVDNDLEMTMNGDIEGSPISYGDALMIDITMTLRADSTNSKVPVSIVTNAVDNGDRGW